MKVCDKNKNNWYIGAMTNFSKRDLSIPTNFLDDKTYTITILKDRMNADKHAADYSITRQTIKKGEMLNIKMESGGGWVAILSPE